MLRTREPAGWTSQFRDLVMDLNAVLHDLRGGDAPFQPSLDPAAYGASQAFGTALRAAGSEGIVYPSVHHSGGECAGLFYPDRVQGVVQGRCLDYHWNGARVDYYREPESGVVDAVRDPQMRQAR